MSRNIYADISDRTVNYFARTGCPKAATERATRIGDGSYRVIHGPSPSKAIYKANWERKRAMGCRHYLDAPAFYALGGN